MQNVAQVLDKAKQRGVMIATAESCTGGLIAGALTEITGSSAVFDRGFVIYSNAAKSSMLGVSTTTLSDFGAVSEQVAAEMASGAFDRSDAQIAVSVTGIAGPGGSDHKPEGMVCFGITTAKQTYTETQQFGPLGRSAVRQATVDRALTLVLQTLDSI